jgi:hypothetical protein
LYSCILITYFSDYGTQSTPEASNMDLSSLPIISIALRELTGKPDPILVTTHYLRPVQGGTVGRIEATLIRSGRTMATAQGTLSHDGNDRLVVINGMTTCDWAVPGSNAN